MFLPAVTGFANQTPEPSVLTAPQAISNPSPKSPVPTVPEVNGTEFNWRRDKNPQPLTTTAAKPEMTTTKEGEHSWETGRAKSYLIPALEVPGFLGLLSAYDRIVHSDETEDGKKVYSSTFASS